MAPDPATRPATDRFRVRRDVVLGGDAVLPEDMKARKGMASPVRYFYAR